MYEYNILIQFGDPMKLLRLMKILNETCSKLQTVKHLLCTFPVQSTLKKVMLYKHCLSNLPEERSLRRSKQTRTV